MSDKKPMVLVFAGPNGSGKSTINSYFEIVGKYTNADDVVSATGMTNKEAMQYVDKMRYAAIDAGEDFTFETVLSSPYKMEILAKAKGNGYFIKCVFVLTVNPLVNVARVKARVANGGHDVPEEKIRSRYTKSLANIEQLMQMCDILHVYDNTEKPIRIIRKHKDDITIYPNDLWSKENLLQLIGWGDTDSCE